jgi:hypothetical protein
MKKALNITMSGLIITAIIGFTIMLVGAAANEPIIIDFSVPFLITSEVFCIVSLVLALIVERR